MLSDDSGAGAMRVKASEPFPAWSNADRDDPRVPFLGPSFQIRTGGTRCAIRLRDLSCGGASGLCDEPLDVGAFVKVCFDAQHIVEAEVRWVRLMYVGLKFTQPLAPGYLRRLHQAHGTFEPVRSGAR